MRLTVIGCSGSFPGPHSPASSYLLQAGDADGRTWNLLLDLGNGALGSLQRHLDPALLDAVCLSHLHPDHCADLTGLYVTRKYGPGGPIARPLPVHGPSETFAQIVSMYYGSRPREIAKQYAVSVVHDRSSFEVGPFTLTAYAVRHPVEAYGYRVEAGGTVLAFTGDTDTCDALLPLMHDADLVLADAAFVDGRDESRGIHLTGSRAAAAAVAAGGVGRLMLTHIPAWNDPQECRVQAERVWPGAVLLARPSASYEIRAEGGTSPVAGPVRAPRNGPVPA